MMREPQVHLPWEKNARSFMTSVVCHNWQAMVMIRPEGHHNAIVLLGDCRILADELRKIADKLEGAER